jgi:SAM-dependent methyltransferase/FKBP-type peptidyl-prolyl cis-trans isomerase 2
VERKEAMELMRIDSDSMVDMIFHLKWKSEFARHTDGYQASRINIWRDFFSPNLRDHITGRQAGERFEVNLKAGEILPPFDKNSLVKINRAQFEQDTARQGISAPGVGRFYPRGLLKGVSGVFSANIQPCRCVEINNGNLTMDLNHPLSGRDLALSAVIGKVEAKSIERGGSSVDWMELLTSGPGMQARWQGGQSEYFSPGAFTKEDETPDALFYAKPRYVQHIDTTAVEMVKNTYGRFLTDDMQVLDLMSSWKSHLPESLNLKRVVGLGLNENELKKNPQLTEAVVQDLNLNSKLPFESNIFDAAICSLSVEYLIDPLAVFVEVGRILQPDGYFVLTFSNRWFPTKAISIWKELHEFERMGLVLEFFIRSGEFENLQTYSLRGLPRPHDDKYFPDIWYSDPIYAVWGQKKSK